LKRKIYIQKVYVPIWLNPATVSYIDELIRLGLFSSRSEVIRYAIQRLVELYFFSPNAITKREEVGIA